MILVFERDHIAILVNHYPSCSCFPSHSALASPVLKSACVVAALQTIYTLHKSDECNHSWSTSSGTAAGICRETSGSVASCIFSLFKNISPFPYLSLPPLLSPYLSTPPSHPIPPSLLGYLDNTSTYGCARRGLPFRRCVKENIGLTAGIPL